MTGITNSSLRFFLSAALALAAAGALRADGGAGAAELGETAFAPVPAEAWDFDDLSWKTDGGAFVSSGHGLYASAVAPARELEIRASVRPLRCRNPAAASLGVAAYGSAGDYWQLTLSKTSAGCGSRRRFELRAMSGGVWGRERGEARLLEIRDCGGWDFGRTYELSLRCGPGRAVGRVVDAESGEVVFRAVYGPVRAGGAEVFAASAPTGFRPALCVAGFFRGRVDEVLSRGAGAPEAVAGGPLPECVPVAGHPDPDGGLLAGLIGDAAAECLERTWTALVDLPAVPDSPGAGSPGLRGAAAAAWRPDAAGGAQAAVAAAEGPGPNDASGGGAAVRQCSLAAAPPPAAAAAARRPSGAGGALFVLPQSAAGDVFRRTDRPAPSGSRGSSGGHERGGAAGGSGSGPAPRASGGPAGTDALKWNFAPPPEEVAAGPPAAA